MLTQMELLTRTDPSDKDTPLRYDIRLLGRILGDTIRLHEGEQVFGVIEEIRQIAIRFHRDADEKARQQLQEIICALPIDRAVQIIRAFSYFSHLANLAEDQHHIRRVRAHALAKSPPRQGTMAHALERAKQAGVTRERARLTAKWKLPDCWTSVTGASLRPKNSTKIATRCAERSLLFGRPAFYVGSGCGSLTRS